MNDDRDIRTHVASLNPHTAAEVERLDLTDAEADLLDAVMRDAAQEPARSRPTRSRRRRLVAAGGVACAVALATAFGLTSFGDDGSQAWGAEARAFAQRAQHMLIDGWAVTRADEYGGEGEVSFTRDGRRADLHWRRTTVANLKQDRAASADLTVQATVGDAPATVYRYRDAPATPPDGAVATPPVVPDAGAPGSQAGLRQFTAVWRGQSATMELRAAVASLDEFRAILTEVHRTPVDRWLAAMPASVIIPGKRAEAVDAMLRDIPVPPEVDVAELRRGVAVQDRYQLGAQVSGTVACAWFTRLRAAEARGDARSARDALTAIEGTRRWTILREMRADGGYPEEVWRLAGTAAGRTDAAAGTKLTRAEALSAARLQESLGC